MRITYLSAASGQKLMANNVKTGKDATQQIMMSWLLPVCPRPPGFFSSTAVVAWQRFADLIFSSLTHKVRVL
jgi:hypothetical protein